MPPEANEKRMRLRYDGRCRVCDVALEARTEAIYERTTRTVRCLSCTRLAEAEPVCTAAPRSTDVDPAFNDSRQTGEIKDQPGSGTAGASARREYERRKTKREQRVRAKHPKLGGLILALSDDPQSTTAWSGGAQGEERLGGLLNQLRDQGVRMLHDRRIPGTRANIDHLAVTPSGVYVIDAKRYVGQRPTLKIEGGILRPRVETLLVGSRDRSKLIDGVHNQVEVVKARIADHIPVKGVLCFVDADWPLIGGSFTTQNVDILWPKKLCSLLVADGPHTAGAADLQARLAHALPPA